MELHSSPPPPHPHTPQSPQHSEALTQRMKEDTCFRCNNKGHWATYCPLGSPGSSPSKAKRSSSASSDIPVMHCTCGAACDVRRTIASNPKNPNRKYYFCPGNSQEGNGCRFVEWCDKFTARQCPCGAGICRVYAEKEGNGGPWKKFSYGCRVRKGNGACSFVLKIGEEGPIKAQPQASRMKIEPLAKNLADVSRDEDIEELLQCGSKKLDEMMPRLSGPELSSDIDLQEMVKEDGSGTTNHDSVVEDLAMEDIALLDHISQIENETPSMMSRVSEIKSLQEDFMKQISAVGDGLTQVTFNSILARQVMGWCGRIVFQPSRRIPEPQPRPFFCCIFPSVGAMMESGEVIANRDCRLLSRRLLSHIPSRPGLNDCFSGSSLPSDPLSPRTNEHPMQLLAWLADSLNRGDINQPSNFRTEGRYAELLQRTAADVQNEFIALLDRIDPLDLELLLNEAVVRFKTLCLLGTADCGEFIRRVMHYIECASSLAKTESSHGPDPSSQLQELKNQHEVKRKRYEDMSQLHSKKMNAYGASQGRLEALAQNADRLREMLGQVEREMAECQEESFELERQLVEMNQEVKSSRRSMEAVARELGEAQDKEVKRAAAKDALDKARSQLRL